MKKNLFLVFMLILGMGSVSFAQNFLQIRQKALSEEISPGFTYIISGPAGYSATLSDRPDAIPIIFNIAGDADGGVFAVAGGSESWTGNPGNIYYRPSGMATWENLGVPALKVQGSDNGGYISLVRSGPSFPLDQKVANSIKAREDGVSSETDITYNLSDELFMSVAHNFDGTSYVLVKTGEDVGEIYKKEAAEEVWVSTGITGVQSMVAVPNSSQIVYAKYVDGEWNQIYMANNDNTGVVSQGNPIPAWNDDRIEEMAITYNENGDLELWALSVALIYKTVGPDTWAEEDGINDMRKITSTGGKILKAVLLDDASVNIPYRIFSRSQDGVYLDDERVQTSFNGNTVNFPVTPGTYTITQTPMPGWHTTDIRVNETTSAGTSTDLVAGTATVVVSSEEVVVVEFENQSTTVTVLDDECGTNFVEDFSSYKEGDWGKAMDGLTSYHKASGNFGYGYYAIVSSTDVMSYGDDIYDHTSGDATGSMLLVDATFEKGIFYRRRFTGLIPGAKYNFGAWIANFNPPAGDKPNVSFEIYGTDGTELKSVASGDVLTSKWQNFSTVFQAANTEIELVLRNNTQRTRGNDLAIDDISFGLSIPQPEAKVVFYCETDRAKVTVTSPVSIGGSTENYEYSLNGTDWQSSPVFESVTEGNYTLYVRYFDAPDGSCEATVPVNVSKSCIDISGNVWYDANGNVEIEMTELPISGDPSDDNGGNSSPTGSNVYVNLVDGDGEVISSVRVSNTGTYSFGAQSGIEYKIILSRVQMVPGDQLSAGKVPLGWVLTGTNDPVNGVNNDNQSVVVDLQLVTTSLSNINFGIQTPPAADDKHFVVEESAFSVTAPAGFTTFSGYKSIPMSSAALTGYDAGGSLTGSDSEDCPAPSSCNAGATFNIHEINGNTRIFYDFGGTTNVVEIDVTSGMVTIENFDISKLVIYGRNGSGGSGNELGFTYSITDVAGATSDPVTYTILTSYPLPVELVYFGLSKEGNTVHLNWETLTERSNMGFEIERSADGLSWAKIGYKESVAIEGKSKQRLRYTFADLSPFTGKNYYRLRQVDFDGSFTNSQIKVIVTDIRPTFFIYPNPVSDGIVKFSGQALGIMHADVYNLTGRRVMQQTGVKENMLNVSHLAAGVYIIKIVLVNGETVESKLLIE